MFGNYSPQAIKEISIERTNQVINEIEKLEGKVSAMHALLGKYDVLLCVNLPNIEAALQASVRLHKLTGISFTTFPAVPIETFDQLTAKT